MIRLCILQPTCDKPWLREGMFVLRDTLPTCYDAAISSFSVAMKSNGWKMKETINSYANSLIEIQEKSFTSNHVLRHKAVVERLEKLVSLYYNNVYNVANCTSSKHESDTTHPKSIRSINKEWKEKSIEFRINGKKTLFPISSLFDIVKEKTLLEGVEKVFCNDQKHTRVCRVKKQMRHGWQNNCHMWLYP